MRTSVRLAIVSSSLFLLGGFLACGSSDSGSTVGRGGTGSGAKAGAGGSAANVDGGGGTSGKIDGGGTGGSIINFDSGNNDITVLPDACATQTVQATLKPAYILFLIDRTGSMNCNAPPTQTTAQCDAKPQKLDPLQPSKWEITRDAFKAAIADLKATQPVPSVGIALFNNNDECGFPTTPEVAVAELLDPQINTIVLTLDAVTPKGNTPIVGALMSAYGYLKQQQTPGNKFVVLLTDGAETCDPGYKDTLVTKTEEATWIGIRTFALGAPGSEPERSFLSRIAYNGGTAADPMCDHSNTAPDQGDCHVDMTLAGTVFSDELKKALAKVSGAALTCEIDVPKEDGGKADPDKVNVMFTSGAGTESTIPKDDTDPCDQGWQYTDSSQTKIKVCGAKCDEIKSDPKGSLSVQLGCATYVPK